MDSSNCFDSLFDLTHRLYFTVSLWRVSYHLLSHLFGKRGFLRQILKTVGLPKNGSGPLLNAERAETSIVGAK